MIKYALTYDDIQLIPRFSEVKTRKLINLGTNLSKRYKLLMPLVASPMDTVCEVDMAYKMFALGGVGCIHRFNSYIAQSSMVSELKEKIKNSKKLKNSWEGIEVPIMAAIGVLEEDTKRAKMLVDNGANVLLIDVAHGDHQNVLDMIRWCKENLPPHVDIIAGNIATAIAAERLENAGADGLRVGIGGGSLCSTRIQTGFGIPNVTAIEDIVMSTDLPVMADGGIRNSGDISKALSLGASTVMLGSLLAGTDESPGSIIETSTGLYKKYRGSASLETKLTHGKETRNVEGESTLIHYKGGVKFIISGLLDGLRSALSYAGAESLDEFSPDYVIVTNSGINEAKPHLLK